MCFHQNRQREQEIEELQAQVDGFQDLKKESESMRTSRTAENTTTEMIESLKSTVSKLEAEIMEKNEALKREKDTQYELMDKLNESQEAMDEFAAELKDARTSSSQQQYRNDDRVKQLETTIIELNHQIKEQNENMEKARSVIRLLRSENLEIEEELGGLVLEMERDTESRIEQKRKSIHRIQAVVHKLGGSDLIDVDHDYIADKLSDLAENVSEEQSQWREKEREYREDIDRLSREHKEMRGILTEVVQSKIHSLSVFNEQMEQLRRVIKAQEMQIVRGRKRTLWPKFVLS